MNSKLHTTLPPSIRSQEKWKFCICHCPMFVESNRTVPNSTRMAIFIAIWLGGYSSNVIGGTPINYVWLNSPLQFCVFWILQRPNSGVDGKENYYAIPILLSFCDVLLHFKNVFIGHVWEFGSCISWAKCMV